jgi:hypothetical protein
VNYPHIKKIYVDGDLLLYGVGFATQKNIYHIYVDELLVWVGSDKKQINRIFKGVDYSYEKYIYIQPLLAAIETYKTIIKNYKKLFGTEDLEVILTGDTNFRNDIAKAKVYKGTRTQDKPHNYRGLKEYMIKDGAIVTENEEADDYISYKTYNNYEVVAVTEDKDAINTPSYIYNPKKKELTYVDEPMATKHFWTQVLTGDMVDNIPGLPNCGEVGARTILEECTTYAECERATALAYACNKKLDDPEAYLLEQGTLLWMRREPNEMWRIGL